MIPVAVFLLLLVDVKCSTLKRATPHFEAGHTVGVVTSHSITEESGLCASRTHANILYTHNDSGGRNRIFAIDSTNGHRKATITINGAHSHDWEDIACGPCPNGGNCVYVGDTGGNAGNYEANYIYRIREPSTLHDQMTVNLDSFLHFSWEERDCETLMVDNHADVYVVSKRHHGYSKVFQVPKSSWGNSNAVHLSNGVTVPIYTSSYGPVGGDISLNGQDIVMKTYGHVYYWHVEPGSNIMNTLSHHPSSLPYKYEHQGESVCWDAQGRGYFTISEGYDSHLHYYSRN